MQGDAYMKMGAFFSAFLIKEIGLDKVVEVVRKNKEDSGDWCASHQYCDANMVMAQAFRVVMGREIDIESDDCILWGDAWKYCQENNFFIK